MIDWLNRVRFAYKPQGQENYPVLPSNKLFHNSPFLIGTRRHNFPVICMFDPNRNDNAPLAKQDGA